MFTHLLIPLDGSALAERALPPALALARHFSAEITLVRVPEAAPIFIPAEGGYGLHYTERAQEEASAAAWTYLNSLQAEHALSGLTIRARLAEGDVAGALVDAAEEVRADLIAMSSHGYSGLTRFVLGSVAEKVLRAAACPVLVVRASQPIQHVLVTLDGSALAGHVLGPALDVAEALGARVTLLRVLPDLGPTDLQSLDELERGLSDRLLDEVQAGAQAYLDQVAATFARPGVEITTQIGTGPAAAAILTHAEAHAVDLIAMATHGRTGLRRWLVGSVTEKVLHSAACSMLVVRPKEMQ